MSDFVYCVLSYSFMSLIFGTWQLLTYKVKKDVLDKLHFRFSIVTFWLIHIFNIVYTGLMGWHRSPGSRLEQSLDNVTIAGYFLSFIMYMVAARVGKQRPKKK